MNKIKRVIMIFVMAMILSILVPANVSEAAITSNQSPLNAKVVVLDPGHCRAHPGAKGYGVKEEELVWYITSKCQEELNKYADVTVYMTRDAGSCCTCLGLGDCLTARSNYAKKLGADFLCSMHINAGSSTASGACVLTGYDSGYNQQIATETQRFGLIALSNLQRLGIKNNGLLLRRSENGGRYPNGALSDYYSIVRHGVNNKIPAVIIEHGYLSNPYECRKLFYTFESVYAMGKADAASIVQYFGLNLPVYDGNFQMKEDGYHFVTAEGEDVIGWVKKNGNWYYLDPETGVLHTGLLNYMGRTFFLGSDGRLMTGWISAGGGTYLAQGNGAFVKNGAFSDGVYTYLFDASGNRLPGGIHQVGGDYYYVDASGHVGTGLVRANGTYYYFDSDGKMAKGLRVFRGRYIYLDPQTGSVCFNRIINYRGRCYYFNKYGVLSAGSACINGDWYYFNPRTYQMHVGWLKIGRNYMFYGRDGKLIRNRWVGRYYFNAGGVLSAVR